jgi:IclR family pca regulon transcriptional regulator
MDRYFARTKRKPMTERAVVSPTRLRNLLAEVRQTGYAVNDQELELGLRSIAVAVRGPRARCWRRSTAARKRHA